MRNLLALLFAIAIAGACSSGSSPTFSVSDATADPTYWCPGNASNAPYDLHATVHLHNPTSSSVTVTGVTAELELAAVKGPWIEKVGEVYNAGDAAFAPAAAPPKSSTTMKVTVRSACTSPAYGTSSASYGDYKVTLHIKTTAGSYSISASNLHRILTA